MIEKNLRVWLSDQPSIEPPIRLNQYDTLWRLIFTVYNGNIVWDLADVSAVMLMGQTEGQTVFAYPGTINGQNVIVDCQEQMTSTSGRVECELRFTDGLGGLINTANFTLMVEKAPLTGYVPSRSEFDGLNQLINDAMAGIPTYIHDHFSDDAAIQAAAQAAQSAEDAEDYATAAAESAQDAQSYAQAAQEYGGHPPILYNGNWWLWDVAEQGYHDSGIAGTLAIVKVYSSYSAMDSDVGNMDEGDIVTITGTPAQTESGNVYIKSDGEWIFLKNLSGIEGPQGPQGPQGEQGPQGTTGATGPNAVSGSTATSFNGILKGNGTVVAKATPGTDYIAPPSKATSLPTSGTALTADTEYEVSSAVGTYQFNFPSTGDVYVKFTTASSTSISFASGTKFLGIAPTFEASTTYVMYARDKMVSVAKVQ